MNKKLKINITSCKMFSKTVLVFSLLFFCNYVSSQQSKNIVYRTKFKQLFYTYPDSSYFYINKLKQGFNKDHDTIKAQDYNNFAIYFLFNGQKDSAIYYLKQSLRLGTPSNKPKTLLSLGLVYKKLGDYDKAIVIYDSIIKLNNTSPKVKGKAYSEMASMYSLKVDFDKCKFYFLKAIEIAEKSKDSVTLYVNKINFGNFYKKNSLPELALPLYNETTHYFYKKNNWRNYFISMLNLASCYDLLNNLNEASTVVNEIDITNLKRLNDSRILASYYNIKAHLLRQQNFQNTRLDSLYRVSLQYAKESKDTQFLSYYNKYLDYLVDVGAINKINKDLIDFQLDSVSKNADLISKIEFLSILSHTNLDITFNNFNKEELFTLKDSLFSMTSKTMKDELLSNNSKLQNVNFQQEKLKTKQRTYFYVIWILVGLLLYGSFRYRFQLKRLLIKTANSIDIINNTHKETVLELKKEVIDINLNNAINFDKNTDKDHKQNNVYWNRFKQTLKNIDPVFISTLKNSYPDLSQSEIDLCAFMKLNMSNKQIAELLTIAYRSVIVKKSRLKKKLNIPESVKLEDFIMSL